MADTWDAVVIGGSGVVLAGGEEVRAPVVVSAVHARVHVSP
jgi:hypothetical protein